MFVNMVVINVSYCIYHFIQVSPVSQYFFPVSLVSCLRVIWLASTSQMLLHIMDPHNAIIPWCPMFKVLFHLLKFAHSVLLLLSTL